MDEDDKTVEIEFNNIHNIGSFKDNVAVISSNKDVLYIHTNIFNFKDENSNFDSNLIDDDADANNQPIIYDLSKIAQKLDADGIKQLIIKTLNSQIELNKEEIKVFDADIKSNSSYDNIRNIVEDASYELNVRQKGEKLSSDQIDLLKEITRDSSIETMEICRAYNVSPTTINKIKRSTFKSNYNTKTKEYVKIYGTKNQKLIKLIKEYVKENKYTFTAKEVTDFVNLKLNSEYSVSKIRCFMKRKLQLSFKRVKSRPANINLQKINRIRSLFAVKLTKEISTDTLLINIDESSINRDVKTNYSWDIKEKRLKQKIHHFLGQLAEF